MTWLAYPGRRYALPWAVLFMAFQAKDAIVLGLSGRRHIVTGISGHVWVVTSITGPSNGGA